MTAPDARRTTPTVAVVGGTTIGTLPELPRAAANDDGAVPAEDAAGAVTTVLAMVGAS